MSAVTGLAAGQETTEPRGSIEGVVRYRGVVPPPTIVIQSGDAQHVLHVGDDGELRYAVAYVRRPTASSPGGHGSNGSAAAAGAPRTTGAGTARDARGSSETAGLPTVILDQRGYIFRPPVLAVRAGQLVRFTSQDPAHHNVRSDDPNPANAFSVDTDGRLVRPQRRFALNPDDRPVELTCDIHPWMVAWVYVFDHPHYDVTDAAGRFRITDLEPGRYTLSVRHPAGGLSRDLTVEVEPGRSTTLVVEFSTEDLRLPG